MSGLRHVIFDCDGTLVDSQVIICAAMTRAFESLGLRPPSRDATLSIIGLSLPEAMARLAPGKGAARQAALVQAYKDGFGALRGDPAHHEPLYPGVRTVIDTLAGEPETFLSIATGKSQRGVSRVLELHAMDGIFHSVHTADECRSKPHPEMIERAIAATGVAPERAVMVGDTTYDMDMARAAGALPIGVAWGYHPACALMAAGAACVIDRFEALLDVLADLVPIRLSV